MGIYNQKKEIQEMLQKQSTEVSETNEATTEQNENEKYKHRSPGFSGTVSFLWEYYKWPILIGLLIAVGIFIGIRQIATNANPDLVITHVGPFYISSESQDELQESIAMLSGDAEGDYNGDGKFNFSFLDLTITYVYDSNNTAYTYDDNNSAYTRFQTELRAGDTLLYFLEPYYYEQAKQEGILQPLDEILDDASCSFDGYGIYLGDLDCFSLPGFDRMQASTVVCLRQNPSSDNISYGRTTANWNYHCSLLQAMVAYQSDDAYIESENQPDISIEIIGNSRLYKYITDDLKSMLSSLSTDWNLDGESKCGVQSLTLSGTTQQKAQIQKAIHTELVTGSTSLLILDEDSFSYAVKHNLLAKIPEEYTEESSYDGYGIILSSIPCYEESALSHLDGSYILCIRNSPDTEIESYGRTQENYEKANTLFYSIMNA